VPILSTGLSDALHHLMEIEGVVFFKQILMREVVVGLAL
jgi:hypothetical protein